MSWWRRRSAPSASGGRAEQKAETGRVREDLEGFIRSRRGVEAYMEPPTTVTPPTVLLIAASGEWMRRRLPERGIVRDLADRMALPVYDVQLVGYPQRMRDWNERVKRGEAHPEDDGRAPEDGIDFEK